MHFIRYPLPRSMGTPPSSSATVQVRPTPEAPVWLACLLGGFPTQLPRGPPCPDGWSTWIQESLNFAPHYMSSFLI